MLRSTRALLEWAGRRVVYLKVLDPSRVRSDHMPGSRVGFHIVVPIPKEAPNVLQLSDFCTLVDEFIKKTSKRFVTCRGATAYDHHLRKIQEVHVQQRVVLSTPLDGGMVAYQGSQRGPTITGTSGSMPVKIRNWDEEN